MPTPAFKSAKLDALLEERRRLGRDRFRGADSLVADIISVLWLSPTGMQTVEVKVQVLEVRTKRGEHIPPRFDDSLQNVFQEHCFNAPTFKKTGKPEAEALFYRPRRGIWAMYPDRAAAWLQARTIPTLQELL